MYPPHFVTRVTIFIPLTSPFLMQFGYADQPTHKLQVYNGNSDKAFTRVVLAGTVIIDNLLLHDS